MKKPKKISLISYGNHGGISVLKLEGRQFPGALIQCDSLINLRVLLNELQETIENDTNSSRDICDEALSLISNVINSYNEVMSEYKDD